MFRVTEGLIRKKFYSGAEVSGILGVTGARVRFLCSEGRFDGAFNFGGAWLIPKESVDGFGRLKRGRKAKGNAGEPASE